MALIKILMDWVRFVLTVTRPYSFAFLDAIYRVIYGAKIVLPPIDDKILLMSATDLAKGIRKKQLSSEIVMKAYIRRIQEVEPQVNACVDQRFTDALEDARNVDHFLSITQKSEDEIEKETPLLGVPFTCKEAIGVKGMAQTCGLYSAKDRKAEEDSASAALYRSAGAIPVVTTNVPELCTWWESANVAFGRTRNPYDNIRSAGGSSGGEAAVLAYAGGVIGIGNDLAGSIRIPSAFNGIYGHKPSPCIISNFGTWPPDIKEIDHFVATGPMCRYVQDLPLLTSILSENRIRFDKKVDFRTLNIYYMEQFPGHLLCPTKDIQTAITKAVCYFGDTYNNAASKLYISEFEHALKIWENKLLEAGIPAFKDFVFGRNSLILEFFKYLVGCSEHTLPAIYYAAIEVQKKDLQYQKFIAMFDSLKSKMDDILKGGSILLLPTHPEPAPHYLMTIPKYPNVAYTCIMNALGYPSTHIPTGLSKGLPIGIQVVSARNCDHICVSTAVELDKVFGGWTSPSGIKV